MKRTMGVLALVSFACLSGCAAAKTDPAQAAGTAPTGFSAAGLAGGGDPAAISVTQRQELGVPFDWEQTFSEGSPSVQWRVTVDKVGAETILKDAADNPAWRGGEDQPMRIVARPAAGKKFYVLSATFENIGRTPATAPPDFDDVITDKGRFLQTNDDDSTGRNLTEDADTYPINPGDSTKYFKVWSVPAGATATAVLFPKTWIGGGAEVQVNLESPSA